MWVGKALERYKDRETGGVVSNEMDEPRLTQQCAYTNWSNTTWVSVGLKLGTTANILLFLSQGISTARVASQFSFKLRNLSFWEAELFKWYILFRFLAHEDISQPAHNLIIANSNCLDISGNTGISAVSLIVLNSRHLLSTFWPRRWSGGTCCNDKKISQAWRD